VQPPKASVLLDLANCIQGLKQKLQELNQLKVATARKIADYDPMPKVRESHPNASEKTGKQFYYSW